MSLQAIELSFSKDETKRIHDKIFSKVHLPERHLTTSPNPLNQMLQIFFFSTPLNDGYDLI